MIDPRIFRAYDIRGKAYSQITTEACQSIGYAFGKVLIDRYGKAQLSPRVVVGRDARTHSPEFESAMIEGLASAGCTVIHIGQTPSPVNYFTVCKHGYEGGVQITASHNPKEDNGIKLCTRDADAFSGEDLQQLRRSIEEKSTVLKPQTSNLITRPFNAITPYLQAVTTLFAGVGAGLKIAVDSGNGVAGPLYCEILRKVGCEVTELYTEPDGNFPNHPADPSKHSTLKDLQACVQKNSLDLGFAFDGDGDRLGIVDENGAIVTADQTMLLLAQDHLSRYPGAPVIFTVSNSSLLETEVKKWGGRPVMCKVGHSFVEHAMREEKSLLGGEQSGHFFCGEDYYGFDDAIVAGLRILAILGSPRALDPLPIKKEQCLKKESTLSPQAESSLPTKMIQSKKNIDGSTSPRRVLLSHLTQEFPTVFQSPERRPECPDDKKAEVVQKATEHFQKKYPVVTLDGARIDFGEGAWAGIRYSNTSPCLSICLEARTESALCAMEKEVLEHLGTYRDVRMDS